VPATEIRRLYKNRILASLSGSDLKVLVPHLVPVKLNVNDTLGAARKEITDAYFLEEGLCSIVVEMMDGTSVEVGVVGKEAIVGAASVLGMERTPHRAAMQIAGSGFRISLKTLREQAEGLSELRSWLQRSTQGLLTVTAQIAACNRVHEMHQRLSRWILTCHDRVESDRMLITHDGMATALGTGRPTVTIAAGILQKAGLIVYSRGHITIQDRNGLEQAACECYRVVRDEYRHLGLLVRKAESRSNQHEL
jgi:CRP-like cAMP-binding protein